MKVYELKDEIPEDIANDHDEALSDEDVDSAEEEDDGAA